MTDQLLTRTTPTSSPVGFTTLLTLIPVTLQLTGIIAVTFSSLLNWLVRV